MIKFNPLENKRFILSFKFLSFFVVIYLLFSFINKNDFLKILQNINFYGLLPIFFLFILHTFLVTVRWFIIIKNFSKISLLSFFKNIVQGYSFSLILSSQLPLEAAKFLKIKKELGNKKSIILIAIDKFFTLYFKVFFVLVSLLLYLYFYKNFQIDYVLVIIFIIFILIILFFKLSDLIFFILKKFNSKVNFKLFNQILKIIKKQLPKIIVANLTLQLVNCTLYFFIFANLKEMINVISLFVFVPIIELLSQFQVLIFGMKELITVFMFSFLKINAEISLVGALMYTFIEFLAVIFLYLILNFKKN